MLAGALFFCSVAIVFTAAVSDAFFFPSLFSFSVCFVCLFDVSIGKVSFHPQYWTSVSDEAKELIKRLLTMDKVGIMSMVVLLVVVVVEVVVLVADVGWLVLSALVVVLLVL